MPENKPLDPKRSAFVREYLVDFNAFQAAIRAGYSETYAQNAGHELLGNPLVAAELARLTEKKARKLDITAEMVLNGIKDIALAEDTRKGDKLKAFELLGKYLALFVDRQSHENPDGSPLYPSEITITLVRAGE